MVVDLKTRYVELLLQSGVLRFGRFKTKSGRDSPYFFNAGHFDSGLRLDRVGEIYARTILDLYGDSVDNLYGPAYKGITLAAATATHLSRLTGRDISFTFNRKEAKDHGEGGTLVGRQYQGGEKVLIIEDVITGGTSFRETLALLQKQPVAIQGLIVGIDRQEKGLSDDLSALQEVRKTTGVRADALITISEVVERLYAKELLGRVWIDAPGLTSIRTYLERYGVGYSLP